MSDFQWDELHIEWFSNFIKDKADITASSFGRDDIPRIGRKPVNKQDRHKLMELVVKRGLAVPIIGKPDASNYCIHLIPEDSKKHYLECQMMFDDRITDLPQSAWLEHPVYFNNKLVFPWLDCKLQWLEIINLLRVYMVKGDISKENLQQPWDKDYQKILLSKAKKKAKLYALVCIGWELFDCTFDGAYSSPEDCFLDMLFCDAALQLDATVQSTGRCRQENNTIGGRYNALNQIVQYKKTGDGSGDYSQEEARRNAVKMSQRIIGEKKLASGEYIYDKKMKHILFTTGHWLMQEGKKYNDKAFNQALKEVIDVGTLELELELLIANRERNSSQK
jgi:uncharacterized protein (UPF0297 family)